MTTITITRPARRRRRSDGDGTITFRLTKQQAALVARSLQVLAEAYAGVPGTTHQQAVDTYRQLFDPKEAA